MKQAFKKFVLKQLHKATAAFFKAHPGVKLVAVVGSVGKTSTKLAVAEVLKRKYKVLTHSENHNTEFSVPLALMEIPYPKNVHSPLAWILVLLIARQRRKQPFTHEVIVIELGTDKPGDIPAFGEYLNPDIAVVTAVSPEHMEFFKTLDAVAKEELSVGVYSKVLLVNRDDVDERYAALVETANISTYGMGGVAEYHYLPEQTAADGGYEGKLVAPEFGEVHVHLSLIGEHSVKAVIAATAVATKLGMVPADIKTAVEAIRPVKGRMQPLRGAKQSFIIDDTYNSSPLAAGAAMQTLYSLPNPHKLVILGSMNELGESSKQEHERLGLMCDPTMLDWVITIGDDAGKYLAPAAHSRGCQVKSFKSAYDAGSFAHSVLEPLSAVLVKGSQTNVYAEEAIKVLLHSAADEDKLVRQSPEWIKKKQAFFSKF